MCPLNTEHRKKRSTAVRVTDSNRITEANAVACNEPTQPRKCTLRKWTKKSGTILIVTCNQ